MAGRIALVIGNGAYQDASALKNPANDAAGVAAALTRIGFSGVGPSGGGYAVDVRTPGVAALLDVTLRSLSSAFAAFGRLAEHADQAVLYYAGHGIEVAGQNYLIPVDARISHVKDVAFQAVSLMQVLQTIDGGSGLRLVVLDACRDNPFRTRLLGAAARDLSRGLRAIEPSGSILVAYAAKHGTAARDGQGANSPFATSLLAHIETPGLEIVDLFRTVKDDVLAATGRAQEPHLYGTPGMRREYLVPPLAQPPLTTTIIVDERTIEHTLWVNLERRDAIGEVEDFIRRYPQGNYVRAAHSLCEERLMACKDFSRLTSFAAKYPDSPRLPIAQARLADLAWASLEAKGAALQISDVRAFLERHPGPFEINRRSMAFAAGFEDPAKRAKAKIGAMAAAQWARLKRSTDAAALTRFSSEFQDLPEAALAKTRLAEVMQMSRSRRRALSGWELFLIWFGASILGIAGLGVLSINSGASPTPGMVLGIGVAIMVGRKLRQDWIARQTVGLLSSYLSGTPGTNTPAARTRALTWLLGAGVVAVLVGVGALIWFVLNVPARQLEHVSPAPAVTAPVDASVTEAAPPIAVQPDPNVFDLSSPNAPAPVEPQPQNTLNTGPAN